MFDYEELAGLKNKLAAIATGNTRPPSDWRRTKIGKWSDDGLVKEAQRISSPRLPEWWREPRESNLAGVNALLEGAGLGKVRTRDDVESEQQSLAPHAKGGTGTSAGEVAEAQRDKAKRGGAVTDEEEWQKYIGEPSDDAHAWLAELGKKLNLNDAGNAGFFGTLLDHIRSKGKGARIADLDPELVALCLKMICKE